MTRHLVIFAKAPRLGRVKRRLGREIGDLAATRFYRHSLAITIARCADDPRWTTWLWVTPDSETGHPAWPGRARVVGQGGGGLGARMARPFRELPPGPVVLIGSDIPAVSRDAIAAAFRALGRHDLVFGPARDGGFWLVGARRTRPWPRGIFAGVRWSTPHALADTRRNIEPRFAVGLLDTLEDVDDAASYRRWKGATA
ncbi:MAG: TIGR04282 family arsenosugar biosynthesis glycosyltransferase [Rhodospirillales bacterium]|nr:TIGR04282 family arsenosugar biosynthesis glycosyltransferase [Rhodospirillales bacterium]